MRIFSGARILTILAIFLWQFPAYSSDFTPHRLWKAEKNNGKGVVVKLYFLGITHFGLPIEYDDYFYKKVIPIFKKAETFSFEGAGGREDEVNPFCDPSILDSQALSIFIQAQNDIVAAAIDYDIAMMIEAKSRGFEDPRSIEFIKKTKEKFIRSQDEFELMQISRNYNLGVKNKSTKSLPELKGSVVNYLTRYKAIRIFDVDSKYMAKKLYCSSGPERIEFFKDYIYGDRSESNYSVASLTGEFESILASGEASKESVMSLGGLSSNFICKRNEAWVSEIGKINDNRIHFFALGAMHLNDFKSEDVNCDGLISLLSKKGFSISPIK